MSSHLRATSPSGSFYALSEDGNGDFNVVTQLGTGRGVKLLYSKSKVYVHPTRSERDNIPGYVALLEQKTPRDERPSTSASTDPRNTVSSSDLLLAWVPERSLGDLETIYVKVDMDIDSDSPPKQSYIVAPPPTVTSHTGVSDGYAFAIPVSAVFSLQVRPPNPGWFHGSIIINSRMGATFPPLFFHDSESQSTIAQRKKRLRETFDPFAGASYWGGPEVVRWLQRFVHVERSPAEPTIYLIDPSKEDSLAFGSGSGGSHALSGRKSGSPTTTAGRSELAELGRPTSSPSTEPFMKLMREAGWNIMERFSKVTTYTRRAAEEALDNPNLPPQVRRLIRSPQVQTMQEEYESARVYLARWAMGLQEQSDRERGRRLWTARDVIDLEETDVGEFEILDGTSTFSSLSLADRRKRVSQKEWNKWFDSRTGCLQVTPDEVKNRIFHGGLEDGSSGTGDDSEEGIRKEAWLFLLGVYDWDSTSDERRAQIASLRDQYYRLKGSWWDRLVNLGGESAEGEDWREQRHRIEKDVHRTDRNVEIFAGDSDRHPDPASPFADIGTNPHLEKLKEILLTYNEFNKTLGYVQGMSDLLSPLYVVIQDDAVAFWAFQHFMDRMERNFLMDQSGMRAQLLALSHLVRFMDPVLFRHLEETDSANFFCFFRMILVWYKREFSFTDILRLWDSLFTDFMSANFHLFIALAILEKHRAVIIDHLRQFDEVLKYINELSGTMDLGELLIRAESLFRRFRHMVEVIDKKNNFPAAKNAAKDNEKKEEEEGKKKRASLSATTATRSRSRIRDSFGRKGSGESTATTNTSDDPAEAVVTPELRELLSRKVAIRQPATSDAKAVEVQTARGKSEGEDKEKKTEKEQEDKGKQPEGKPPADQQPDSEPSNNVQPVESSQGNDPKGKHPEGK